MRGRIQIAGSDYAVKCDCADDWKARVAAEVTTTEEASFDATATRRKRGALSATTPAAHHQCHTPSKFRITRVDHFRGGRVSPRDFTAQDVRSFLGTPSSMRYVATRTQPLHDIDGRAASRPGSGVLGTPGGDAGEFVLALQVYETLRAGEPLALGDVGHLLTAYLAATKPRPFAMHTSRDAVEALASEMEVEDLDLQRPRAESADLRARLLGACPAGVVGPCGLLNPDNVGDLHLRAMAKYPGRYLVSNRIVALFTQAFYSLLWADADARDYGDGDTGDGGGRSAAGNARSSTTSSIAAAAARGGQLLLEIYPGKRFHTERAVVNIRTSEGCRAAGLSPLINVRTRAASIFVDHPSATEMRREELADFFAKQNPGHHVLASDMVQRMQRIGLRGYLNTVARIAQGLPVYDVWLL